MSRIERLAARHERPLLVTASANVRYLTGLSSSNAALLVEPDASATLYADFRYAERAQAVEGVVFVEVGRNLVSSVAELLVGRKIAFEGAHLSFAGYRTLEERGVDTSPTAGLVEALRMVKDADEIAWTRHAAALSDRVFEELAHERFTGRTERELVWWVERRFQEGGAEGFSFPANVAAGITAASPHAVPGDRVIEKGMLVVVDAGCIVGGYCSDCTRTFSTGDLPERLTDVYALCLEAQLAGLAAVQPSVSGVEADAASRVPKDRSCDLSRRTCSSPGTW